MPTAPLLAILGSQVTPTRVPGLVAWYRAADITGLVDGDPVATWNDSSGLGNHATQGTAAKRPTYKTGILNGKPVVRLATDDGLVVADSATYKTAAITMFIVCTSTVVGSTIVNYPHAGTHTTPFYRWGFYHGGGGAIDLRIDTDAPNTAVNASWATPTIYAYSTATRTVHRNGAPFYAGTPRTVTYPNATGLRIGFNADGTECMSGDIAEILLYGADVAGAQRRGLERYLSREHAVALA